MSMQQPAAARIPAPDRAALCADLEATRRAFRDLVASVGEAGWHQPSAGTTWTKGQLLVHLADALARLPTELAHARRGRDYLNPPRPLLPLVPTIGWLMTWWSARGQTPASTLARYEAAHGAALAAIATVGDDEWGLGANYFGEGYRTIVDLCRQPNSHFLEHAAQVG